MMCVAKLFNMLSICDFVTSFLSITHKWSQSYFVQQSKFAGHLYKVPIKTQTHPAATGWDTRSQQ
jgi:hypothetical protein